MIILEQYIYIYFIKNLILKVQIALQFYYYILINFFLKTQKKILKFLN